MPTRDPPTPTAQPPLSLHNLSPARPSRLGFVRSSPCSGSHRQVDGEVNEESEETLLARKNLFVVVGSDVGSLNCPNEIEP